MSRNEKILVGALAAGAVAAGATSYYFARKYNECSKGSAKSPVKSQTRA
jgi:hypothetical protein